MLGRRDVTIGLCSGLLGASLGHASERSDPDGSVLESAYYYGFGPFAMARSTAIALGQGERANTFAHRRTLADHASRTVNTPNNDTLYSSARYDLSTGPIDIHIPTLTDRYFVVAFMDAFTDNFAMPGTRQSGGKGGVWRLAPHDYRGEAPEGVTLLRAPTTDGWILARVLVDGDGDLPAAVAAQSKLSVVPLRPGAAGTPFPIKPGDGTDPANFLATVNMYLGRTR